MVEAANERSLNAERSLDTERSLGARFTGMRAGAKTQLSEDNMADQKNWRSKSITGGVARAPNRAMLRAVGFKDGDFEKPIVGVANGHSTHEPLQRRHPAAGGPRDCRAGALGRQAAGVRRADDHRRHRHGHRGDEVFAGVARGDRRRDRNLGQRPGHGRRAGGRRLRQEHARRHDGDRAHERARRSTSTPARSSRGNGKAWT